MRRVWDIFFYCKISSHLGGGGEIYFLLKDLGHLCDMMTQIVGECNKFSSELLSRSYGPDYFFELL